MSHLRPTASLAILTALAASLHAPATAADGTPIKINSFPNAKALPLQVGIAKGFFARRGLSIDFGGSWLLPRLIGMHRAKELALLADIISAKEAAEMGLVNRVVPASELDAFVADWADRLAAGPPIALGLTKRLLGNSFAVSMDEALEAEGMAQSVNTGT